MRFYLTPVMTVLIFVGCAARGGLDASWLAPVTNTGGSRLTDLAPYRVYYSTTDIRVPRAAWLPRWPLGCEFGTRTSGVSVKWTCKPDHEAIRKRFT